MRILVDRDPFAAALARAAALAPRQGKNTLPIISHILLTATPDGRLTLDTTDLDIFVTAPCAAKVEEAGASTVLAARLHDIVRQLPTGGEVALVLARDNGAERLILTCGHSRYSLPTLPAGDFPAPSRDAVTAGGEVSAAALARVIDLTAHAQSTDDTRLYLTGAQFHILGEPDAPLFTAVATDGYRLAQAEFPCPPIGFSDWPAVTVPRKAVAEIRRILGDASGVVDLRASESLIVLVTGRGDRLVSKLLGTAFPDYLRIIPRDPPHSVLTDVDTLTAALNRAASLSDESRPILRIALAAGAMRLTGRGEDFSQGSEDLEFDWSGPDLEFGIVARNVTDQLARIKGENALFGFTGDRDAILITDPTDPATRAVLMPTKT